MRTSWRKIVPEILHVWFMSSSVSCIVEYVFPTQWKELGLERDGLRQVLRIGDAIYQRCISQLKLDLGYLAKLGVIVYLSRLIEVPP